MKVAVIGSGVAGLATAIRVAARGDIVTLFEKNGTPGGKISQIRDKGYRFDTGPSLFTLPNLVDELLSMNLNSDIQTSLSGKNSFNYFRLENSCRYFYPDGTVFDFFQNTQKLREQIENNTDENFENILKRLNQSEFIYNLTSDLFIFNSFHRFSNFLKEENRSIPLHLHKLGFHRTMHSANKSLFKDKRIVQLFDRYATYNGSSPYKAPATLNMISHLEHNIGAFFPEKGIYSIADSLYKKGVELGVNFEFNSLVTEVIVEKFKGTREKKNEIYSGENYNDNSGDENTSNFGKPWRGKRAVGVRVNGVSKYFDYVVCDTDVSYAAENMFNGRYRHPLKKRLSKLEPSSSALIFYWGIKGEFNRLDIHNILFTSNYKEEFDYLFKKRELYSDPTVYIFISKKVVAGDAPDGCENWFVMVNAPYNKGQDWQAVIANARKAIIQKIDKTFNIKIEDYIDVEHIASPVTIERNTLSSKGALYGSSSNSMFSAFLRHPNTLNKIKNLSFTGGSTHPGGGIPLCLASAIIAEKEIYKL
ncbi:MAG: phytoene desaturase family protein [Bacteroidales bacterium]|nr:phytoene desaturase family protein [Bacteroidales bacterium]